MHLPPSANYTSGVACALNVAEIPGMTNYSFFFLCGDFYLLV